MPDTWSTPAAPPQYSTKRASNANEQVLGLYQQNFGRSASLPEIDGWVQHVGGGAYLSPDQLNTIQGEFKKAPEYQQYTGVRPTFSAGDYIPGVTLGQSLSQDQALRQLMAQQPPSNISPIGGPAPATPAIPNPLPGSTSGQTAQGNTGPAQQETTTSGLQALIRDQLIGMMNQPMPTANDPALAGATSAFNAAQNRSTARQVNQNAEAFGAQGLESSGARLAADRGAIEQQGLNEGTFGSQLVLQELESRRDQTQRALQMASAINDQDLSRRLQEQLAQLQATIQREGLAQQGRLGQADIDLRQKLGMGNLNLGALQLAQQGRQFNDSLGFNLASLEAQLNNQALTRLLWGS
jgi:hypothetical protein